MDNENKLMLVRAQKAVVSRDFSLALRLYNALLKKNPSSKFLLQSLASAYVKAGNDAQALSYYKKLHELDKSDFNALNNLGGIYRRLHRYEDSVSVLKTALALGTNDVLAQYSLGFTYREMKKYDEAIACFQFVLDENPNDVLAYNHLGSIYAIRGEYQKALSSYLRGLQVDHNHPVLQFNIGKSFEALHNDVAAVKAYAQALRAKPGWLDAIHAYADLLMKHHRLNEAKDVLEKAVVIHSKDKELYNMLGEIYLAEFDYDAALSALKKAYALGDENSNTIKNLARAYELSGKADEAVSVIEKAKRLAKETPLLQKQYAHALLSADKYDEAAAQIQSLRESGERDAEALDLSGQYFILRDLDEKAKELFGKINEVNPSYKQYKKEAAFRYKQKGDDTNAKKMFDEYLRDKKNDAASLIALAELDEKAGNVLGAKEKYRRILKNHAGNVKAKNALAKLSERASEEKTAESFELNSDIDALFADDKMPEIVMDEITEPEERKTEDIEVQPKEMQSESFDFNAFDEENLKDGDNALDVFDEDFVNETIDDDALENLLPDQPLDKDAKEKLSMDKDEFSPEAANDSPDFESDFAYEDERIADAEIPQFRPVETKDDGMNVTNRNAEPRNSADDFAQFANQEARRIAREALDEAREANEKVKNTNALSDALSQAKDDLRKETEDTLSKIKKAGDELIDTISEAKEFAAEKEEKRDVVQNAFENALSKILNANEALDSKIEEAKPERENISDIQNAAHTESDYSEPEASADEDASQAGNAHPQKIAVSRVTGKGLLSIATQVREVFIHTTSEIA